MAALKQSLAANQQLQKQYKWVETTVISMKGEEKSRTQKQCFYGPDGKVQKQPLSAPPQQAAPGGVKGKLVEKKKAEITATMTQAVELVHQYVPPDPQRIQAAKAAGNLAITRIGPNSARLDLPQLREERRHAEPRPRHGRQRAPDGQREVVPRRPRPTRSRWT